MRRMEPEDTVEPALLLLQKLQAEGWALECMEHSIRYKKPDVKGRKLPVEAQVVITFIPAR